MTNTLDTDGNRFQQNLSFTDHLRLAVIGFHVGLFLWTMFYLLLTPLILLIRPQVGIILLLPLIWTFYDRNAPKMGGKKSQWFCNLKIFNSFRDYFPTRLIKTADLPAGRNYILAHFPHSVMPFNILPNFLSNSNKVAELYPQIDMLLVGHEGIFNIPVIRDFILALGCCSCSESSFTYLLKSKPSKGIIVVPGGAAEIYFTKPGSIYKIVKRKGFIRLSLSNGSPLVPVFTFGEINSWNKVIAIPFKRMGKYITNRAQDLFIPIGRGFLCHKYGIFPKKIPINTVVGAPIPVPKVENPSKELIDEYHEKFFQALHDLFEKYKLEYDIAGSQAQLIML